LNLDTKGGYTSEGKSIRQKNVWQM